MYIAAVYMSDGFAGRFPGDDPNQPGYCNGTGRGHCTRYGSRERQVLHFHRRSHRSGIDQGAIDDAPEAENQHAPGGMPLTGTSAGRAEF